MAKKNVVRVPVSLVATALTWHFPNGSYTFDTAKVSAEIADMAKIHGLKQKLADSMADQSSMAEKRAAIVEVGDRLLSGQWNGVRAGLVGGILYTAMDRIYPERWADAAAFVEYLGEVAKKQDVSVGAVAEALKLQSKVKGVIDQIREEQAAVLPVSGDEILAMFEEEEESEEA